MKQLLQVKRQPMAMFANAREAAMAVPIPNQKVHKFIETIHNIPLYGLADKASYMKMGNEKVWATFRACHLTASILLSTVFKAMGKDAQGKDIEVENSQGLALLNSPNEWDSLEELLYTWVFHMKLCGEAYWHLDEIDAKGRPKNIYPLLPQYVFPVAGETERITKFIYRINGRQIEYMPEEILYFRRPNPASLIAGMGDIEPSVDLYTGFVNRNKYEKEFLKNGAMPSGVLTYEGSQEAPAELADIEDETWGEMKKWWQVEYAGANNAGKTVMLPGAWKYLRLGLTNEEMQTMEREKWSVEQIFTNHGVPLSLAGIKDAANYATAKLDEINFRKYEIVPLLDLLVGKINNQGTRSLFQSFDPGQRLTYELSGLIDVEQTFLDYEGLVRLGGMTLNELRNAMGLPKDSDNPLLDGYYVDQSRVPLEMSGQDGPTQAALDAVQRSLGNPGKVTRGRRSR